MEAQTPVTRDKVSEGTGFCLCPTDPHLVCSQTNGISTWAGQKGITEWSRKRPDEEAWANSAILLRWQDPSPTRLHRKSQTHLTVPMSSLEALASQSSEAP